LRLRTNYPLVCRETPDFSFAGGWFSVVDRALARLETIAGREVAAGQEPFLVSRVYEKVGTLRVDTTSSRPDVEAIVLAAENESEKVCEKCGQPGALRDDREWLAVLCDAHAGSGEKS